MKKNVVVSLGILFFSELLFSQTSTVREEKITNFKIKVGGVTAYDLGDLDVVKDAYQGLNAAEREHEAVRELLSRKLKDAINHLSDPGYENFDAENIAKYLFERTGARVQLYELNSSAAILYYTQTLGDREFTETEYLLTFHKASKRESRISTQYLIDMVKEYQAGTYQKYLTIDNGSLRRESFQNHNASVINLMLDNGVVPTYEEAIMAYGYFVRSGPNGDGLRPHQIEQARVGKELSDKIINAYVNGGAQEGSTVANACSRTFRWARLFKSKYILTPPSY